MRRRGGGRMRGRDGGGESARARFKFSAAQGSWLPFGALYRIIQYCIKPLTSLSNAFLSSSSSSLSSFSFSSSSSSPPECSLHVQVPRLELSNHSMLMPEHTPGRADLIRSNSSHMWILARARVRACMYVFVHVSHTCRGSVIVYTHMHVWPTHEVEYLR